MFYPLLSIIVLPETCIYEMNAVDVHTGNTVLPLVSCIMPTFNRRAFVSDAIRYFLLQDYENKELLIADDGTDCIKDLVPDNKQIRYIRIQKTMTLGEKRNFCIRESRGDLIMHWDDDDWMAPYRISYQVSELLLNNVEVCGLQEMYFYEFGTGKCWLYKYPSKARSWLAGGSLLYSRSFWKKAPFPDMQVASDTHFIFSRELRSFKVLSDNRFYVAAIHRNNTSPKKTANHFWHPVQPEVLKDIIGDDGLTLFKIKETNQKPEPCISKMKKKIALLITTCNRPASLKKIISDLQREKKGYELTFFIVDDGLNKNGKKNYWKTINSLWGQAKAEDFDYYIQLPDDVQLEERFIQKAITAWNNIDDPKKICLNLFLDSHRMGKPCWTNFWPKVNLFNDKRYLKTQWMDLFYICEKKFFTLQQWNIQPVHPSRWIANPELSSGVGQQVSLKLHGMGLHLYQVTEKLAEHIGDISIMNPGIRRREPMKSAGLSLIYAGMASVPGREAQLKKTVASIEPYIDHLFLFLNDYQDIPEWVRQHKKITPFLSRMEKSNKGDAGKFFGLNKITVRDFYYFTLDDDMLYPPDYTWKMIGKIEKHHRKVVVGCGGYIMKGVVNQFYNDRQTNWHISMPNKEDRPVHILHTCLTAWHSSALQFRYEDCEKPNMGDIWLALAAQKNHVPMILIERPVNWVLPQPLPVIQTIYGRFRNSCPDQTTAFNSWAHWKILPFEKAIVRPVISTV